MAGNRERVTQHPRRIGISHKLEQEPKPKAHGRLCFAGRSQSTMPEARGGGPPPTPPPLGARPQTPTFPPPPPRGSLGGDLPPDPPAGALRPRPHRFSPPPAPHPGGSAVYRKTPPQEKSQVRRSPPGRACARAGAGPSRCRALPPWAGQRAGGAGLVLVGRRRPWAGQRAGGAGLVLVGRRRPWAGQRAGGGRSLAACFFAAGRWSAFSVFKPS